MKTSIQPTAAAGRPPVFKAESVTSGYGDLMAIRDVSLEVQPGEIVALFGPNGAGKTTFLMTAMGALPARSGGFEYQGKPLQGPVFRRARSGLKLVPEERSVVVDLTVRANLQLGSGGVEGALTVCPELEPLLDRRAGLLSGGEQQILVLARQLASGAGCLLVDELSLGLAPKIVERLLGVIADRASQGELAVLLVEQQVRLAMEFVDRWYLLKGGRIASEGDSQELIRLEGLYFST